MLAVLIAGNGDVQIWIGLLCRDFQIKFNEIRLIDTKLNYGGAHTDCCDSYRLE
jgi:hypothetical protein